MAKRTIKAGDYVKITGTGTYSDGKQGHVSAVYRANADYERRAKVLISSAYTPIIAVKFLEPVE